MNDTTDHAFSPATDCRAGVKCRNFKCLRTQRCHRDELIELLKEAQARIFVHCGNDGLYDRISAALPKAESDQNHS